MGPMTRISRKIAAITESATLAVDAKAKALQAAGEHVIGFGAGRARLPDARAIVEAAVVACRDARNHQYSPAAGLPELREAIAAKTARDSGFECDGRAGARHQRRQAGRRTTRSRCSSTRATRCCCPAPYWTTYPEAIALADGVPVVLPTTRGDRRSGSRSTSSTPRVTPRTKALLFVSPSQPDRRGVPARGGRGDRPVGGRARHLGRHRRDLRAPHLRRPPLHVDAGARPRARRHVRRRQRRREDVRDDRAGASAG